MQRSSAPLLVVLACWLPACPSQPEPEGCPPLEWAEPDDPGPLPCSMDGAGVHKLAVADEQTAWVVWGADENLSTNCVQPVCDARFPEDDRELMWEGEWPDRSLFVAGTFDGGQTWMKPIRLSGGYTHRGTTLDVDADGDSVRILLFDRSDDDQVVRMIRTDDRGLTWDSQTTWAMPQDFRDDCGLNSGDCVGAGWLQPAGPRVGLLLLEWDPEDPWSGDVWVSYADTMDDRLRLPDNPVVRGGFVGDDLVIAGVTEDPEEQEPLTLGIIDLGDEEPAYRQLEVPQILNPTFGFFDVLPVSDSLAGMMATPDAWYRLDLTEHEEGWSVSHLAESTWEEPLYDPLSVHELAVARIDGEESLIRVWGPNGEPPSFRVMTGTGPGEEPQLLEANPENWVNGSFEVSGSPNTDGLHWVTMGHSSGAYGVFDLEP